LTLQEFAPWLASGGVTGVIAVTFLKLHQSAVRAHEKRADGWQKIAEERERQLMHILTAVQEAKDKAAP